MLSESKTNSLHNYYSQLPFASYTGQPTSRLKALSGEGGCGDVAAAATTQSAGGCPLTHQDVASVTSSGCGLSNLVTFQLPSCCYGLSHEPRYSKPEMVQTTALG